MVDFLQILIHLTRYELLIDKLKCHTKGQCAICFGQILTIVMVGAYHQEEQDLHLDKTYHKTSIIQIVSNWSPEHIN